ncbi:type II toxin-antitoxin system VapC family toxin [Sandarakinorhabdus sp.]|uniref:type II toxin-antitoxin system VapC family toxin n=1 Tax=Sandarakinorhabdus sp. TaxID=1916663 RepID=UPI00286DBE27|nr:type II toxin-antitoxin system VapC family toxin [Sandarakinorhabdus sp.]
MIAVDTNVLVRFLTRDDAVQAAAAERLFADNDILLLTSVIVETEWVLRAAYRWPRGIINTALAALLRLERVTVAAATGAAWALERHAAGADLADMLHLVAATGADGFATFDRRIAVEAGEAGPVPVLTL